MSIGLDGEMIVGASVMLSVRLNDETDESTHGSFCAGWSEERADIYARQVLGQRRKHAFREELAKNIEKVFALKTCVLECFVPFCLQYISECGSFFSKIAIGAEG